MIFHPKLDENGKQVKLNKPSNSTSLTTWYSASEVATVVPEGPLPDALNGIPFAQWSDVPRSAEKWNSIEGQLAFEEPHFQLPSHRKAAAGVVVLEADGRIWLVSPSNAFGGYNATFPKGRIDSSTNRQAAAIREAYEESGLKVAITGFLADSNRSQTYTRYYLARRVGGTPASMGWESQAVHLVPRSALGNFLVHLNDKPLLSAILDMECSPV